MLWNPHEQVVLRGTMLVDRLLSRLPEQKGVHELLIPVEIPEFLRCALVEHGERVSGSLDCALTFIDRFLGAVKIEQA